MEVSVALTKEWKPEWRNNREDNNPIVVVHKAPTMALKERLIPKPKIKYIIRDDQSSGGETEIEVDNKHIIEEMLLEIRNCTIKITDEDGEVEILEIKSAKDLFSPKAPAMISGLADEIGVYFQRLLQGQGADSKN